MYFFIFSSNHFEDLPSLITRPLSHSITTSLPPFPTSFYYSSDAFLSPSLYLSFLLPIILFHCSLDLISLLDAPKWQFCMAELALIFDDCGMGRSGKLAGPVVPLLARPRQCSILFRSLHPTLLGSGAYPFTFYQGEGGWAGLPALNYSTTSQVYHLRIPWCKIKVFAPSLKTFLMGAVEEVKKKKGGGG